MNAENVIRSLLGRAFLEPPVTVGTLEEVPAKMVYSLPSELRTAFGLVFADIKEYGTANHKRISDHANGDGMKIMGLLSDALRDAPPIEEVLANLHQVIFHNSLQPPVLEPFKPTDLWNARLFVYLHGNNVRFCNELGGWHVYEEMRWIRAECGEVERLAKNTVRHIYEMAHVESGDERRQAMAKHAVRSESAEKIKALLELARSEEGIGVKPEAFDADPWELNVANGTLDLRSGVIRAHRRGDLLKNIVEVPFQMEATCPTWERFLCSTTAGNRELISFLQRACGYSLSGRTNEQCLFFLYGPEAAGKSTFIRVLQHVLGKYARTAEIQTFTVRRDGAARNDLARLAGARLVAAIEPGEGQIFDESLIKQLTGEDKVSARFLFKEHFEFFPTFKIWLAGNHRPHIRSTGGSMWRRMRVLPFTRTVPEGDRDHRLFDKLMAEKEGILAWMIRGCAAWQREGLGIPETVRAATREYRKAEDVVSPFIDECGVVGKDERVAKGTFYQAYRQWCEETGEKPLSQKAFGVRMEEIGFDEYRNKKTRYWLGIGISNEK